MGFVEFDIGLNFNWEASGEHHVRVELYPRAIWEGMPHHLQCQMDGRRVSYPQFPSQLDFGSQTKVGKQERVIVPCMIRSSQEM